MLYLYDIQEPFIFGPTFRAEVFSRPSPEVRVLVPAWGDYSIFRQKMQMTKVLILEQQNYIL